MINKLGSEREAELSRQPDSSTVTAEDLGNCMEVELSDIVGKGMVESAMETEKEEICWVADVVERDDDDGVLSLLLPFHRSPLCLPSS